MMLIEQFEQVVESFSSHTAVEVKETGLTYLELNQQANRLAHVLLKRLSKKDNKTDGRDIPQAALLFEKGIDMIVSLLAVLKAGMAFVPLDIFYPEQRIKYMLEHSQSLMLLTNRNHQTLAESVTAAMDPAVEIVYVEELPTGVADTNPERTVSPDQRAYILYTSGSTGNPKGVVQNHHNVLYYVRNWIRVFDITAADRMTMLTAFTHDGAMQDIFAALLSGAALLPFDIKTMLDRGDLSTFIKEKEITIWHSVPTLYRYFIEDFSGEESYPRLRAVILGGEPLREHDVELFRTYFPGAVMANVYGQTESSVGTICRIDAQASFKKIVLGEPLDETEILLMDDDDGIIEDMGAGEIVILSDYLAPCYWQDPEETRRKFARDPELGRMYWTGDLGAYLGGGEIEILGRKDFQVKIRGFRVETGEIETQLLSYPEVKETAVTARQDDRGDIYLCGYIVAADTKEEEPEESLLRDYLFSRLPDYMVPSRFVILDRMPLTASGKIDRKALPEPVGEAPTDTFIPPETASEKKLAALWHEVLFGADHPDRHISRRDHFFQLGGHSLRAMTVISGVHKRFSVRLRIEDIFTYPVLADLAAYIDNAAEDVYEDVQPVEQREYYPLSSAQMRLFFLGQMERIGTAYNLPVSVVLEGELDRDRLQSVFLDLIKRHQSFRTSFLFLDETPVQRIHDFSTVEDFHIEDYSATFKDITGWSDDDAEQKDIPMEITEGPLYLALLDLLRRFVRPFDLTAAPLIRVGLIRFNSSNHILMIDIHHIISDGTSMALLVQELMALYRGVKLETPHLCYTDYTLWQLAPPRQRSLQKQEQFWLEQFSGEIPVLDIPTDYSRPAVQSFEGRRIYFSLNEKQGGKLKKLASSLDMTMFMMLMGLYAVFLGKISGQEDIIVGSPVAGRSHADVQTILGMFVNTLAIRSRPERNKTVKQLLLEIKETAFNAFSNQEYPFEDLVDRVNIQKDAGRNPLFDTVFALQNFDAQSGGLPRMDIPGLTLRPFVFDTQVSRFDLLLTAYESNDRYTLLLEYCIHLYKHETMEHFVSLFKHVVDNVLDNPSLPLGKIDIISDSEKKKILTEFNDTATDFPADKTLHALFQDQVNRTPDGVALVVEEFFGNTSYRTHITYTMLNLEADALADNMRRTGAGPGIIIALLLERSAEMIITMLAVLKSGAAYMPVDPSYPQERIDYMLNDSRAVLVNKTGELIAGEALNDAAKSSVSQLSIAYIIYTSGTTGKPKGTVITHTNVCRLVKNTNYLDIGSDDRMLQLSNYAFDGSVFDIYGALLNGAVLVMIPGHETAAVDRLARRILAESITVFLITTAMFNALIEYESHCLTHIHTVITGGERMSMVHALKALELLGPGRFYNAYGPTETTVYATMFLVETIAENIYSIPIGAPISNTEIYILDPDMNLVPIGVRGELYIGGPGVGLGYLNKPELTGQRFLPVQPGIRSDKPMGSNRFYKTGDLGRWLPDGTIEFLGRIDQQVKLRGYRIELGEIENRILDFAGVQETVVVMQRRKDGDAFLCAYIVFEAQTEAHEQSLREHLLCSLPDYMIPAYFVALDYIPLTPNGKIDRRALPDPIHAVSMNDIESGQETTIPRSQTEERLRMIWAELLDLETDSIGMATDFFRVGGHSLKAVSLVNAISKVFKVKIDLSSVFQSPTIEGLAAVIEGKRSSRGADRSQEVNILPQPAKPYYDLSFGQRRIWVLQQMNPNSPVFNISSTVYLDGKVNERMVRQVMEQLVRRHGSFRTYFKTVGEEVVQIVADDIRVNLDVTDLSERDEEERESLVLTALKSDMRRVFKLGTLPLYRAKLFILSDTRSVFHFKIHHIIFDGWSLEILQREFATLLEAAREGKDIQLEPLRVSYTDFVHWQNKLVGGDGMARAKEFWKDYLSGELPILKLPYDSTAQPGEGTGSAAYKTVLHQAELEKLNTLALDTQSSLFMVLLAGFQIMLSQLSAQEDVIMSIPGAARRHGDLNNVMGLFVNTLIIRGRIKSKMTFKELLVETRDKTLNVLEFQDYPMERVCEELNIPYPELSVFFNKTDIIETKETLTGLDSLHLKAAQDTKFPITLYLSEYKNGLNLLCCYFSDLFKPETIEKIMGLYIRILENIANDPEQAVSSTYKSKHKKSFRRKS